METCRQFYVYSEVEIKPGFRADNDKVETTITWVRIMILPIELFKEYIIQTIATCIGDPIKIDGNTFNATNGKFAHFCVQIQLDVHLDLGICVEGTVYQVVYQNLLPVCYTCGSAGHVTTTCESSQKAKETMELMEQVNMTPEEPNPNSSVE